MTRPGDARDMPDPKMKHARRSPCCSDEARRYLSAEGKNDDPLARAAIFMLALVDSLYGTDNYGYDADDEGIPSEAEFRRYATIIHEWVEGQHQ